MNRLQVKCWIFAGFIVGLTVTCSRKPQAPPTRLVLTESELSLNVNRIEQELSFIRRYQALVNVRGRGPGGRFRAKLVLIFERPDRLRVELFAGLLGSTQWTAVADEGGITVYFPKRREFLRETAVRDVVRELIGVALVPRDFMALVSGVGVDVSGVKPATGFRLGDRVEIEFSNGARLFIDRAGQIREAECVNYQVSYPTAWKRQGGRVPDQLRLTSDTISTTLTVMGMDINTLLDDEAFLLDIPDDAERLQLTQIGGGALFSLTNSAR